MMKALWIGAFTLLGLSCQANVFKQLAFWRTSLASMTHYGVLEPKRTGPVKVTKCVNVFLQWNPKISNCTMPRVSGMYSMPNVLIKYQVYVFAMKFFWVVSVLVCDYFCLIL